MDDLDSAMMTPEPGLMQMATESPPDAEEEHRGMRRPTLDEFDELKKHPYVQRVNDVFHAIVVDARLKN